MGTACSHPESGEAAELKVPDRHPLYLKWEVLDVPPFDVETRSWERFGGRKLEPLFDRIDLVDLKFMVENIEAGLPMPRWQDVPRGARINRANIHRIQKCMQSATGLAILVLSYPWLDPGHPDSQLITMRRLLPCFKAFLSGLPNDSNEGTTVALLVDFASLPQKNVEGHDDRSDEEKQRFKKGLGTINEWYAHVRTTVLVYDVEMPSKDSGHTNLRPHSKRGWCSFEMRASSMVKDELCLWSLRGFEKGGSPKGFGEAREAATQNVYRPAPLLPEEFGRVLRKGVATGELAFTANADVEVVADQYGKAFEAAFAGVKELYYSNLGWGDKELSSLVAVLLLAKKSNGLEQLQRIDVSNNPVTEASLIDLAEALRGTGCKRFKAWKTHCSEAGKAAVERALEGTDIKMLWAFA